MEGINLIFNLLKVFMLLYSGIGFEQERNERKRKKFICLYGKKDRLRAEGAAQ